MHKIVVVKLKYKFVEHKKRQIILKLLPRIYYIHIS